MKTRAYDTFYYQGGFDFVPEVDNQDLPDFSGNITESIQNSKDL
jgi:hypothetical protein